MVSGPIEAFSTSANTLKVGGVTYSYDNDDFFKVLDKGEWIGKWEPQLAVGATLKATYAPGGMSEWDLTPSASPPPGGGTTPPPATPGAVTGTVQSFSPSAKTMVVGGTTYAWDDSDFFKINDSGEWIVKWEQQLAVGRTIKIAPYAPGGMSEWDLTIP